MGKETETMRELFVDELVAVTGGGSDCPSCHTTMACCEEGPFDGCCEGYDINDIIVIDPPG